MFGRKHIYFSVPLFAVAALGLARAAGPAATAGDISTLQVLNTSPLWADAGSFHVCDVVNATTSTITVTVALISSTGTAYFDVPAVSIPAGQSWFQSDNSNGGAGVSGFARCRFSTNYGPGSIRANETVLAPIANTSNYQTYAVSEAR